jgi:hypothetical protein
MHPGIAFLARWAPPAVMLAAYIMLILTSDTDNTGKAWLSIGFAFVLVVWFLIRFLTARAALSRAIAVGDVDKILEITKRELAKADDKQRERLLLARASAWELRGEWEKVIEELSSVPSTRASARRAFALAELSRLDEARREADLLPKPPATHPAAMDEMLAHLSYALARARVLIAEDKRDLAKKELHYVTSNLRATAQQRATAQRLVKAI